MIDANSEDAEAVGGGISGSSNESVKSARKSKRQSLPSKRTSNFNKSMVESDFSFGGEPEAKNDEQKSNSNGSGKARSQSSNRSSKRKSLPASKTTGVNLVQNTSKRERRITWGSKIVQQYDPS